MGRRQWQPTPVLLPGKSHGGAWWAADHGVAKSQTQLSNFTFTFPFMHWRRKWQPTPVFLPGESQGRGSLVGYCLWYHTESDTTEATWQLSSVMWWWWCLVAKSCPTLDPMDCSPPDSSVHRILQAGILVWVAISFSRGFLTRELNLGLLHCRHVLYQLTYKGSPNVMWATCN